MKGCHEPGPGKAYKHGRCNLIFKTSHAHIRITTNQRPHISLNSSRASTSKYFLLEYSLFGRNGLSISCTLVYHLYSSLCNQPPGHFYSCDVSRMAFLFRLRPVPFPLDKTNKISAKKGLKCEDPLFRIQSPPTPKQKRSKCIRQQQISDQAVICWSCRARHQRNLSKP